MDSTKAILGGMAILGLIVSAIVSFWTAVTVICLLWAWRNFFAPEDRMSCSACTAGLIRGGAVTTSQAGGYKATSQAGGYKATKKDLNALKRFKAGKSIGFTMRSSLKAKGLIPRVNGTRRVSKKYQTRRRR
jgi:hypothetical protein